MRRVLGTSSLSGTYSLKGTIASEAAKKLGLKPGDRVVYVEEDGRVFIEKG